jgi:hypothetical protein
MAAWRDLERELDAWAETGEVATLWWRDDDAATATTALAQLVELTSITEGAPLPIALAVIPARADATLTHAAQKARQITVLQHGYAHANHAAPGAKKAEFPAGRDVLDALRELGEGSRRLMDLFGGTALPVLVPPWNRIDPQLVVRLAEIGIRGLSAYGPRTHITSEISIAVINTHVDIMHWHGSRRFLGTECCLDLAVGHLRARREGRVDPSEPTGVLTHHLVHDPDAWQFLSEFVQRTHAHSAVLWKDARELFGCGQSAVA